MTQRRTQAWPLILALLWPGVMPRSRALFPHGDRTRGEAPTSGSQGGSIAPRQHAGGPRGTS